KDHALYTQYNGIVLDEVEGKAITEALGKKKVRDAFCRPLVVTSSIEATIHFYTALERACQVQLLADAAAAGIGAEMIKINPEQAAETGKLGGSQEVGWFSGCMEFMVLENEEGAKFQGTV
ncbi:hypothetical protein C8R43DRAFT_879531, partial [Mycena crocata]